jgi:hypothetical protein
MAVIAPLLRQLLPGDPWVRLAEMNERFGLDTKAN